MQFRFNYIIKAASSVEHTWHIWGYMQDTGCQLSAVATIVHFLNDYDVLSCVRGYRHDEMHIVHQFICLLSGDRDYAPIIHFVVLKKIFMNNTHRQNCSGRIQLLYSLIKNIAAIADMCTCNPNFPYLLTECVCEGLSYRRANCVFLSI